MNFAGEAVGVAARKLNWFTKYIKRQHTKDVPSAGMSGHETESDAVSWDELSSEAATASGTQGGVSAPLRSGRRPHWLSELESPYGLADADGTLQEIDSANWRRVQRLRRKPRKRFVARTSRPLQPRQTPVASPRWQSEQAGDSHKTTPVRAGSATGSKGGVNVGSTWMLQFGAAIALSLVAIYAHNTSTPVANTIRNVYQQAFGPDYTKAAAPAISRFLTAHHMSVPAFLSQPGLMQLHVPLKGTISQDYSATHPQMAIVGKPNESVMSVGMGTVSRVVPLQSGVMVVISHGKIGSSYYFGLHSASVKAGESVESGQVIGVLPGTQRPKLLFEFEKNGKAVNPHDYIVFRGDASST